MPVTIKILLDQYTEILRKIYGSHLKTVILYGSYARGDYKADSDIDIMILLDLSDIDIKQYRHELSGETFDFNTIQCQIFLRSIFIRLPQTVSPLLSLHSHKMGIHQPSSGNVVGFLLSV